MRFKYRVGSGRNKDTEDLPCLRTKMDGGVVKTRIKFTGTLLKKKKKKSNYKIYPLSLLYQHKRHFKQSLALTILKKFLRVHIYKYINMHFYSSPGRTKTSLKPLGLVPFHSSCLPLCCKFQESRELPVLSHVHPGRLSLSPGWRCGNLP